jgi:hypothetical protein
LNQPDHRPIRLLLVLVFITMAFLSALGVAGVVATAIGAPTQASTVNALLLSFLAPSIATLFGLLAKLLVVVLKQLNSRLTQWMEQMEVTAAQQHAVGKAEALAEARKETLQALSGSGLEPTAKGPLPDPRP